MTPAGKSGAGPAYELSGTRVCRDATGENAGANRVSVMPGSSSQDALPADGDSESERLGAAFSTGVVTPGEIKQRSVETWKNALIHSVMPALVFAAMVYRLRIASPPAVSFQFSGSVITAACWNKRGTSIFYASVRIVLSVISPWKPHCAHILPHATIEKSYRMRTNLTLLRVVYDRILTPVCHCQ